MDCVKALLDAGANPRIPACDSRDALTTIMHCYGDERLEMFKYLYRNGGYSDDEIKPYNLTLLHKAVAADVETINLKIVNYLIDYECEDINAMDGKSR